MVNQLFLIWKKKASELESGRSWEGSPSRRGARLFSMEPLRKAKSWRQGWEQVATTAGSQYEGENKVKGRMGPKITSTT